MNDFHGKIVNGQSIGSIKLGMTLDDVKKELDIASPVRIVSDNKILSIDNAGFWFDEENILYQITVSKDFVGSFKNVISIGSTLQDIKKHLGEYKEELDTYRLEDYDGICFELEDIDDWDELKAPIKFISVYNPEKVF